MKIYHSNIQIKNPYCKCGFLVNNKDHHQQQLIRQIIEDNLSHDHYVTAHMTGEV
jgi:hypothetical protein